MSFYADALWADPPVQPPWLLRRCLCMMHYVSSAKCSLEHSRACGVMQNVYSPSLARTLLTR